MARIDLDHIRHAYTANPTPAGLCAEAMLHHLARTAAPMRCSGRPAAARPRCSTSSPACCTPSHGRLLFDGATSPSCRPQERNIAQVFQFPVIYDTMTVVRQSGLPAAQPRRAGGRGRPRGSREIARDDRPHADRGRKARGLTADQKQKISLGRGLVRSDVNAILFDEPLTVIDPHMKWVLRSQLKQLHRAARLHHGLCHARPDRGADLRRHGGRHV